MSSYQTTSNHNQRSTADRGNRYGLIRKNPPAVLSMLVFSVFAVLAIGALIYLKWHQPNLVLWPAFTVLSISFVWVVFRATRPRKSKSPVQGLTGYAVIGIVSALLSVGTSAALQQSVFSGQASDTPETSVPANQPEDEPEADDTVSVKPEEGASKGYESTPKPDSNDEEVAEPPIERPLVQESGTDPGGTSPEPEPVEPDIAQPKSFHKDEPEPNTLFTAEETPSTPMDLTIPSAEPIILPAGTRLQWEFVDANTVDIRLEEKPGIFVTGLLKTDLCVETLNGEKVSFDVVEAEGRGVAVRSSLVMVIDEALPIAQQQSDVRAALNTVLRNSTYAGYRLVSAGASIRTLIDWTSSSDVIRSGFPRFRQTSGNAFSAAVSLNLNELGKRSNRRILVVVTDAVKALADDSSFRRRLADDEVELVIIGRRDTLNEAHPLTDSVIGLDELPRLKQRMRRLTIHQEDPSYRLQMIDRPQGSPIRLTIGSGASAVTAIILADTVNESGTGRPSR